MKALLLFITLIAAAVAIKKAGDCVTAYCGP